MCKTVKQWFWSWISHAGKRERRKTPQKNTTKIGSVLKAWKDSCSPAQRSFLYLFFFFFFFSLHLSTDARLTVHVPLQNLGLGFQYFKGLSIKRYSFVDSSVVRNPPAAINTSVMDTLQSTKRDCEKVVSHKIRKERNYVLGRTVQAKNQKQNKKQQKNICVILFQIQAFVCPQA